MPVSPKKTIVKCSVCNHNFEKYKCEIKVDQKIFFCSRVCHKKRSIPAEVRFWKHVAKTEGCWEWTGSTSKKGYGKLNIGGVTKAAHRFSYEIANGPIPEKLFVLHRCDNPPCVRPDHLFTGTNEDNVKDMMKKGRHHAQRN